jgi:hypothetical protein
VAGRNASGCGALKLRIPTKPQPRGRIATASHRGAPLQQATRRKLPIAPSDSNGRLRLEVRATFEAGGARHPLHRCAVAPNADNRSSECSAPPRPRSPLAHPLPKPRPISRLPWTHGHLRRGRFLRIRSLAGDSASPRHDSASRRRACRDRPALGRTSSGPAHRRGVDHVIEYHVVKKGSRPAARKRGHARAPQRALVRRSGTHLRAPPSRLSRRSPPASATVRRPHSVARSSDGSAFSAASYPKGARGHG